MNDDEQPENRRLSDATSHKARLHIIDYAGQPHYVEIVPGRVEIRESSGKEYVSLSLSDPAFGPKKLDANLGRAAGQDDGDVFPVE